MKQTKQSLMPLPIVYKRSRDKFGKLVDKFFVKNIGYGPVLNIIFEQFNLHVKNHQTGKLSIEFRLSDPNVLDKNEERGLIVKTTGIKNLSAFLDPSYSGKNYISHKLSRYYRKKISI